MDEVDSLPLSSAIVTQEQNDILIKPFSKDEVTVVVKEMQHDKVLSHDGFQAYFFRISSILFIQRFPKLLFLCFTMVSFQLVVRGLSLF